MTMNSYLVSLTTLKSAERNGGGRAYLARLTAGARGDVRRLFVRPRKVTGGSRALESAARPGDVFEARRWLWDGDRQQYFGGTIWFGVQSDGSLAMLTRDEAMQAVGATAITSSGARPEVPDFRRPHRLIPDDLIITRYDIDAAEKHLIDRGGQTTCLR